MRSLMIWTALIMVAAIPVVVAATSPLLAWREPVYIAAGFAGVAGLVLLLFQPLWAIGALPDLRLQTSRRIHRITGAFLVVAILLHVGALWLTSPPDVVDALLLRSPTPFSLWGVIAMWLMLASALLAFLRKRLGLRPLLWRRIHAGMGGVIVAATIAHALLIEGTMGTLSKWALCVCVAAATLLALRQVLRRT